MHTPLDQTRGRLDDLIEVNQLLMSALEPDALLAAILESARRLFAAEGCSLALIDETARQLAFAVSVGGAKVEEFRIELGQGIAGWVAETGEGVVCNDVSQDPRFFGGVDLQSGFRTTSILCAPLKERDRLTGVIEVLNTTIANGFTQEDLHLLMALGGLIVVAINRAKAFATIRNANVAFQETIQDRYRLVIGPSAAMQEVVRLGRTVATTNTTLLLLGETGTGKEVVARVIHLWSPRSEQPFVAVNCTALAPELLESELFGHERGAFTGAIAQKKGKFELADGGTLFLDEIGELAPNVQSKLLRVLQEREFQRVGGVKEIRTNVRIIAATNRDLRQAIQRGAFREDLYYRLNVVAITLPPLRDRKDDIPGLINHFIDRYCLEINRAPMRSARSAMEILTAYHWPGNVRELQNAIERAVVLSPGPAITAADLPADIRHQAPGPGGAFAPSEVIDETLPLAEAIDDFKRTRIRKALAAAGGNQTQAAKLLGVRQANLSRLMKILGIR